MIKTDREKERNSEKENKIGIERDSRGRKCEYEIGRNSCYEWSKK